MEIRQKLNKQIDEATGQANLWGIFESLELSEIKAFLKQQIANNDELSRKCYFRSQNIIDLFGSDIATECISYLPIYQLYSMQKVSKSFQRLICSLLSSAKMQPIYIKEVGNDLINTFKKWVESDKNTGYFKKSSKYNLAVFMLLENYDDHNVNDDLTEKHLKGRDQILAKCINNMGYKIEKMDLITYAEEPDELFTGLGHIMDALGYIDSFRLDYGRKHPTETLYELDLYYAMVVNVS